MASLPYVQLMVVSSNYRFNVIDSMQIQCYSYRFNATVRGAQPLRAAYVSNVYLHNHWLHDTYRFSTLSAAYVC